MKKETRSVKLQKTWGTYNRNQLILTLLEAGARQADLARFFGVKKQRIHQIKHYKRESFVKRILRFLRGK